MRVVVSEGRRKQRKKGVEVMGGAYRLVRCS